MARRSNYSRLLRWWLDQGYGLADLTGETGGGVRTSDYVHNMAQAPDKIKAINPGGKDALTAIARELQATIRAQADSGQRLHIPALRGDSGKFEKWDLSAVGEHQLRGELREFYRDVRVAGAPPSLRVHAIDRQGNPLVRIEGVGRGSIRTPATRWADVLKERQTNLTREIRAQDRAARSKQTALARERAAARAGELRTEREAVKRDRRTWRD